MDDCTLRKLTISHGKLDPPFTPNLTSYKVVVSSEIKRITLNPVTSDSGASYQIIGAEGSKTVFLKDDRTKIQIEVAAEDGTLKKYTLDVIRLAPHVASLTKLKLSDNLQLDPEFASDVYEFTCTAPFHMVSVIVHPSVPHRKMKVTVNEKEVNQPVSLSAGDTKVKVKVTSLDGVNSQVYLIIITRVQLPWSINFIDLQDDFEYECPVTLTAFYQPVSIRGSDPKHTVSSMCLNLLTSKSKTDPFDESPLGENWRVSEYELDKKISAAFVYCCFKYRGCTSVVKLSELGSHAKECKNQPPAELDSKVVTEAVWYQAEFGISNKVKYQLNHTLKERDWEKKLHEEVNESSVEKLCSYAIEQLNIYQQRLSTAGPRTRFAEGESPLDALHQTAVGYALAIKLTPNDPELHFKLGLVLEEHYYATEMYGIQKSNTQEEDDASSFDDAAKTSSRNDEITAICKLHGFPDQSNLEQQLKALDMEYNQLKERGQSVKADYAQTLYIWKSKQAGKDVKIKALPSEERHRDWAFLKYMDALSLQLENWQYNFHVGFLLLQKKDKGALRYLQTALAQKPESGYIRFYTGLAILDQTGESAPQRVEAIQYIQQGLEELLSKLIFPGGKDPSQEALPLQASHVYCLVNPQLPGGILQLGKALSTPPSGLPEKTMTAEQVFHFAVKLVAQGLCRCPYRGSIFQALEWLLLESHLHLLDLLVQQPDRQERRISKRCNSLSSLIKCSSIPGTDHLLNMKRKVCQLAVVTSPCDSHALYMLGLEQLDEYDNEPSSSNRTEQLINDACRSFRASINLENKPMVGNPPNELTEQEWWQDWKVEQQEKNLLKPLQKPAPRGGAANVRAMPLRGITTRAGGVRGATTRGGRMVYWPAAANPSTSAGGATPPSARGRGAGTAQTKPIAKTEMFLPQTPGTSRGSDVKSVAEKTRSIAQDSSGRPVPINRTSYTYRLGLARALTRINEISEDAQKLYHEVIIMAPERLYIPTSILLIKSSRLTF
ncbi:uncharacterized protein LOC103177898 isoform X2 [Callorhinchus milii]|uniref:uncharacterized protein LOC103177898 isoform X2 n=1 Tax=Callorhinchus milii TaxID=7868 RepID=UPI00045728B9|nr:uncharacterized protein LOC103177898 isoform X2 [Callorhinchus milii]|eukprot:gi/632949964/ref/XP_007890463.1/ PREDICTED: uncharacterized protein LOC103177898 isoform X2 [Callorhinchus milii]